MLNFPPKRFNCPTMGPNIPLNRLNYLTMVLNSPPKRLNYPTMGAQYSSGEAKLSSEEAQLSKFSSYEVCVQRNCGVSASAQVVYEGKTVRVGYHAS